MLLDENGLGDHRTEAARTQESGKRSDDMDEKDDEIAHLVSSQNMELLGIEPRTSNSPETRPGNRRAEECLTLGRQDPATPGRSDERPGSGNVEVTSFGRHAERRVLAGVTFQSA